MDEMIQQEDTAPSEQFFYNIIKFLCTEFVDGRGREVAGGEGHGVRQKIILEINKNPNYIHTAVNIEYML